MSGRFIQVAALGEFGIIITFGNRIEDRTHAKVLALAEMVRRQAWPVVTGIVPGYTALTVYYDAAVVDYEEMGMRLRAMADRIPDDAAVTGSGRELVIPVRYDGPDLAEVAEYSGLSAAEVIARHSARTYRVYLMGFVPGFAYLGELDPALVVPRRAEPRQHVPAGAVAIAGYQTAVYPLATPGGWHLIGSTDLRLFDPDRAEPALLQAGDQVRFQVVAP